MRQIPLTQGKFSMVDDEDYDELNKFKWYAHGDSNVLYAKRHAVDKYNRKRIIGMHEQIMGYVSGLVCDHIDGNGLNNQRNNLRHVTHHQNTMNAQSKRGRSNYKGVHWQSREKRWSSKIKMNYKAIWIGYFDNEEDAARAYDVKAKELFGEYARLNFP